MLMMWQNLFRLSYTLRYVANRLIILNQWIDPEEGTVTINFRVLSVRKLDSRGVNREDTDDELINQLFVRSAE